jgi:cbb3-type cytochrome oxidase subunit 3
MSLSDIMANAGLSIYAEVALVLFMLAFLGIVWWVLRHGNTARWKQASRMPLDDGYPKPPHKGED